MARRYLDLQRTGTAPAVSDASESRIYHDSTADTLKASFNGGAYRNLPHILSGTATFNPADLADGAGETTTVEVVGAALGDPALASFSLDITGLTVTAYVSAADTVSVRVQNETTGSVNIGSGTLKAVVFKL